MQYVARSHLDTRVTAGRLLRCCAPKRAAPETPDLGDRRGSRIGGPRRLGACARRRGWAVDLALSSSDDVARRRRRGQRGQRRAIGATGGADEHGEQVLVLMGSLSRSGPLGSAFGHIGHARRMMRVRRLSVVLRQVLVDDCMRNSPCRLGKRGEHEHERRSASRQSGHRLAGYPFRCMRTNEAAACA